MSHSLVKKKALPAIAAGIAAIAISALALTGCGGQSQEDKTITVAASPTPHAQILNETVKGQLEKEGYTLEVKEFTDYVQPNTVTEEGEVDANYFQHGPYLENFNKEQGTHLISVASVHFEPMGIYAGKTSSLDNLKNGAIVAVPNDATNEARALLLLQDQGLITLADGAGVEATTKDIVSNPKNLEIKELEAAAVPTVIEDVDIAVINGNYAQSAGLEVSKALASESADSLAAKTYANILVVAEDTKDSERPRLLPQLSPRTRRATTSTTPSVALSWPSSKTCPQSQRKNAAPVHSPGRHFYCTRQRAQQRSRSVISSATVFHPTDILQLDRDKPIRGAGELDKIGIVGIFRREGDLDTGIGPDLVVPHDTTRGLLLDVNRLGELLLDGSRNESLTQRLVFEGDFGKRCAINVLVTLSRFLHVSLRLGKGDGAVRPVFLGHFFDDAREFGNDFFTRCLHGTLKEPIGNEPALLPCYFALLILKRHVHGMAVDKRVGRDLLRRVG